MGWTIGCMLGYGGVVSGILSYDAYVSLPYECIYVCVGICVYRKCVSITYYTISIL